MQVQYGTLRHAGHYGIIRRDGAPRESFYAVEAAMGLGGRTANKAEVAD